MPTVSQKDILGFPSHKVVRDLLEFMKLQSTDQEFESKKKDLEGELKNWLCAKDKNVFYEHILFIDFALCQIEQASEKYLFITEKNGLTEKYQEIIKQIISTNQGVATNYNFTSALEIHDQGYPFFSGLYFCSDAKKVADETPSCLRAYAKNLRGIADPFELKSWCAIPVNTPSQTGIYNLAQIFIGFKTSVDSFDSINASIKAKIKDLVSFIHYLSHWQSRDVDMIENLFSIGHIQRKNNALSPETAQNDKAYFQVRLGLFLRQFSNLLLARFVIMPSSGLGAYFTHAYNFGLSKKTDAPESSVLAIFEGHRTEANQGGFSISKQMPSEMQTNEFCTDLVPVPGKCESTTSSRGEKVEINISWFECWEKWKNIRNVNAGANANTPNATMLFIPINPDKDNETYVYAEFFGTEGEIQTQLNIFKKSVVSVVENSIIFLKLYKDSSVSAISAAIGSIMSRNGSHNIGSHVLSALSHNVGTMPDDRVLYQYLQQRMDYTATVTTDFPNWTAPTRFVGNLMKTFFSQRHLLEHISESEGLGAYHFQGRNVADKQTSKIKIHLRKFSGNNWEDAYPSNNNPPVGEWLEFTEYPGDSIEKATSLLKDDVTVAIPGGVVGQHAFYTIVENIIRNAAKHEWASKSKTDGIDNLDIHIDFIDRKDAAKVEFTIWNTCGKLDTKNTPDPLGPAEVKQYLKELMDSKNNGSQDGQVAALPLHHQLQVKLAQQFIDEKDGTLRRENWGLAEMKISAGYLQRRSIGEIGGLEEAKTPIITPVAVPDDKGIYHLGYRFAIPKSKKILIVLHNDIVKPSSEEELKDFGIYFKTVADIEATEKNAKGNIELAYEYVILPEFNNSFKNWLMPFRVLIDKDNLSAANALTASGDFFSGIDYRKLIDMRSAEEIKTAVYEAWLKGLKKKRGIENETVYLQIKADPGDSGGGQGLVSNLDLYGMVFGECGHSIMMEAADDQKIETAKLPTTLLALTPMNKISFPTPPDPKNDDSRIYIVKRLYDFCDYFKRELSFGDGFKQTIDKLLEDHTQPLPETAVSKINDFERAFFRNVQLDLGNNTKSKNTIIRLVTELLNHLNEIDGESLGCELNEFCSDSNIEFDKLVDKLNSAYLASEVFLRKYEENISTLPTFYKESQRGGGPATGPSSLDKVEPYDPEKAGCGKLVSYVRHDKTKSDFYAEALSGSQSYLNALTHFDWGSPELIARLVENALLRVLIVDERVYNFLKSRPDELDSCRKMQIFAGDVADGDKNSQAPDFVGVDRSNKENFGIEAGKYDILIIHQGIIDKWIDAHDKNKVGKLLTELKKVIPYVVVTTGRGRPDNIPDDARVLPFSTIESTIFRKYPEKLVLVNTVMNILPHRVMTEQRSK